MARIRTIKPGFYTNEELSSLPAEIHLFAGGLLCQADDEGYFKANARILHGAIFPLRESSVSPQTYLPELARVGWIQIGTGPDGKQYGRIVHFAEHQVVNRKTPSKIREMAIVWDDIPRTSLSTHAQLSESSSTEGNGREPESEGEKVKISSNDKSNGHDPAMTAALSNVWDYYISKIGRSPTTYSFTKPRRDTGYKRLLECMKKANGVEDAAQLMKCAIDGLSRSSWHMGENPQRKKYADWHDHLFKSYEQMEKWWNA